MIAHSQTSQSRIRRRLPAPLSIAALFLTVALAGCAGTKLPASVAGGECRIFEAPPYEVRGKTTYDQDYIDGNVEAGIGGCGWKRPAARPPGLDARPKANKPAVHKAPKKKPGFLARVKARVIGKPVAPVPYIVAPPPASTVAEPTPAPAPRDPVYELLGVEGKQIISGGATGLLKRWGCWNGANLGIARRGT